MKTLFDFDEEVQLTEENQLVLDSVSGNGGLTRNEISRATGLRINNVTWRIRDLKFFNKIKIGKRRKCTVTGSMCEVIYGSGVNE